MGVEGQKLGSNPGSEGHSQQAQIDLMLQDCASFLIAHTKCAALCEPPLYAAGYGGASDLLCTVSPLTPSP